MRSAFIHSLHYSFINLFNNSRIDRVLKAEDMIRRWLKLPLKYKSVVAKYYHSTHSREEGTKLLSKVQRETERVGYLFS